MKVIEQIENRVEKKREEKELTYWNNCATASAYQIEDVNVRSAVFFTYT